MEVKPLRRIPVTTGVERTYCHKSMFFYIRYLIFMICINQMSAAVFGESLRPLGTNQNLFNEQMVLVL